MSSPGQDKANFSHDIGELVLVKWNDGMVYFAKIRRIDYRKRKCVVVFDDRSTDEADFSQIHSVDETTTDIICIKCKKDDSEFPNEIVLCDSCGIGFHQKCHNPQIPAVALELDNPWHCVYCQRKLKNPYLTESIDVMQTLFADDEKNPNMVTIKQELPDDYEEDEMQTSQDDESIATTESEVDDSHFETNKVKSPVYKRRKGRRGGGPSSGRKSLSKLKPLEAFRQKVTKMNLHLTSRVHRSEYMSPGQERRRGRGAFAGFKRRQPSTVESHTVSVKQVPSTSVNEEQEKGPSLSPRDLQLSPDVSGAGELLASPVISLDKNNVRTDTVENDLTSDEPPSAKRPRSLRVSLTLPPSVETSPKPSSNGSRSGSPKSTELPSWSAFSSNTLDVGYPVRAPTSTAAAASPPSALANTGNLVEDATTDATTKGIASTMNDSKGSLQDDVFEGEDPQGMEAESEPVPSIPSASGAPKCVGNWSQTSYVAGPDTTTLKPDTRPASSIAKNSFNLGQAHKPPTEPTAATEVKELALTPTSVKAQVIQASSPVRSSGEPGASYRVGVLQAPTAGRREVFLPAKANAAAVPLPVKPIPTIPSRSAGVAAKATVQVCAISQSSSATSHVLPGASHVQQMQRKGSTIQGSEAHTHLATEPGRDFSSRPPPSGTRPVRTASAPVYQPPVHSGEQASNPLPLGSQHAVPFRKDIIMATRPKRILHTKTVDVPAIDPQEDEARTGARTKCSPVDASGLGTVVVPQPAQPVVMSSKLPQQSLPIATTIISATGEVASVYTVSSGSHLGGVPRASMGYRVREAPSTPTIADSPVQHVIHDKNHTPLIPVARQVVAQPRSAQASPVIPMQATSVGAARPTHHQQNMVAYYVVDPHPVEEHVGVSAAVTPGYIIDQEMATAVQVAAPVNTTKPYAVVNAISTHPARRACSPKGAMHPYSAPLKSAPMLGPGTYVQPIQSPNTVLQPSKPPTVPPGHHRGGGSTPTNNNSGQVSGQGSKTHPIVIGSNENACQKSAQESTEQNPAQETTYQKPTQDNNGYSSSSMREETTADLADHLRTLSRKFGKEFYNLSEEKLMEMFQDALKKFQRNGKKYELYTRKSFTMQRQTHPNFEVMPSHPPPLAPVQPSQTSVSSSHSQPQSVTRLIQPPHALVSQPPQQTKPPLSQALPIPRPPPLSSTGQQMSSAPALSPHYLPLQARPVSLKSRAVHLPKQVHHPHSVVHVPTSTPISPAPGLSPPVSYMTAPPQGMNVVYVPAHQAVPTHRAIPAHQVVPTHQAIPSLQATTRYQPPQQVVFQTAAVPNKVSSTPTVLAGTPINMVGGTSVNVVGTPTVDMGRAPVKVVAGPSASAVTGTHSSLVTLATVPAEPSPHISQLAPSHAPTSRATYQVQTAGLFVPPSTNTAHVQSKPATASQAVNPRPQMMATQHLQSSSHQSLSESPTGMPVIVQRPIVAPTEMDILASQKIASSPSPSSSVLEAQGGSSGSSRRKASKPTRQCARCSKDATYLCSGCHQEWYCGRECQLKAWDQHADHCKP